VNVESLYRSAGITLEAYGTRWRAPCPFHTEKDPSFVVYPDGGFHCFGCSAHGSARDIQKRFNINYQPFPGLDNAKDPLTDKLSQILSRFEDELSLLTIDLDMDVKCFAYDQFDVIKLDARALLEDIETTLVDLTGFVTRRIRKLKASVEEKQHG